MLIVNAAPIDQSARTIALCRYFGKYTDSVTLLSYPGVRSHPDLPPNARVRYLAEVKTKTRVLCARWVLLWAKLVYLSLAISWALLQEFLAKKARHGRRGRHVCPTEKYRDAVLFVVPPVPVFLWPCIVAKILGLSLMVDWHRLGAGPLRRLEELLARRAYNVCVTGDMAAYWRGKGVQSCFVLPDTELSRTSGAPARALGRKEALARLMERYPEYRAALAGADPDGTFLVCSTSFSEEENVDELLEVVASLPDSVGATLFVTTKHRLSPPSGGVPVVRAFLDHADYLLLLSVCDFGISTHRCYFDFPLKIVDYLSQGLRVIAHSSTPSLQSLDKAAPEAPMALYSSKEELRDILLGLSGKRHTPSVDDLALCAP